MPNKGRTHTVRIGTATKRYKGFGAMLIPPPAIIAVVYYKDKRTEIWGLDDFEGAQEEFRQYLDDLLAAGVRVTAFYYEMGVSPSDETTNPEVSEL